MTNSRPDSDIDIFVVKERMWGGQKKETSGEVKFTGKFDCGVLELTGTLYTIRSTKLRDQEVVSNVTAKTKNQP